MCVYAAIVSGKMQSTRLDTWGRDYPFIVQSWQCNWLLIVPFFDYPAEIRKVIYTVNAIGSVNINHLKLRPARPPVD